MTTETAPADGTVHVTDTKITGLQCFQNLSGFEVRWSTAPITTDNLGAILKAQETTCLSSPKDVYFLVSYNVPLQCWAVKP